MSQLRIGIIIGSTRPGRRGDQIAKWVLEQANQRGDATYELLDLADFALPLLDEPAPPSTGKYAHDATKAWSAAVASYDGYIMVTPEYNHSTSGALKNAIDYLYKEWNNKAVAFVSYGASSGGIRAVEHLRVIAGEMQLADVRRQVAISLATDFESWTTLKYIPHHEPALVEMLDQLVSWSGALRSVRQVALAAA
jgi:NAD(P)H-dependent FMN reductase